MKIAVVGSRDYPKLPRVSEVVRGLPEGATIVSGGARGVDEAAERAARAFGFKTSILPVDTTGLPEDEEERRREYGKRAYARNTRIIESSDMVVAFWTWCRRPNCNRPMQHVTHGTAHAIKEAEAFGKPVVCYGPDGRETDWL